MSAMGLQMIARQDRLWDGYNTEIFIDYDACPPLWIFSHKRGNRCQGERRKIGKHARQELEISKPTSIFLSCAPAVKFVVHSARREEEQQLFERPVLSREC
jgi:hypothetical protein